MLLSGALKTAAGETKYLVPIKDIKEGSYFDLYCKVRRKILCFLRAFFIVRTYLYCILCKKCNCESSVINAKLGRICTG